MNIYTEMAKKKFQVPENKPKVYSAEKKEYTLEEIDEMLQKIGEKEAEVIYLILKLFGVAIGLCLAVMFTISLIAFICATGG